MPIRLTAGLLACLLLVPPAPAAAPPAADPLPGIAARLREDPAGAALLALARLAGTGHEAPSAADPHLRQGAALRARRALEAVQGAVSAKTHQKIEARLMELARAARDRPDQRGAWVALFLLGDGAGEQQVELAARPGYSPFADLVLWKMTRSHDRAVAAAWLALARTHERAGRLYDALACYRLLARDHAKEKVEGDRTPADLLDDLGTDKRYLPVLSWPQGPYPSSYRFTETLLEQQHETTCALTPAGEVLPFFARHRLAFAFGRQPEIAERLVISRRGAAGQTHTIRLAPTELVQFLAQPGLGDQWRLYFQALGHVAFLPLGRRALAVDLLGGRILWERELMPPVHPPTGPPCAPPAG
jgi:hypothetical protein